MIKFIELKGEEQRGYFAFEDGSFSSVIFSKNHGRKVIGLLLVSKIICPVLSIFLLNAIRRSGLPEESKFDENGMLAFVFKNEEPAGFCGSIINNN